ncbi:MAG: glycerol-3-phosphate acyltransferase [Clostridia bacterium]|nr:glycerol-3-phosphate acyltransferase [Clostridia bacterium]MBQ5792853.1 glycerol-3-phosphate acyltransferase [Clostridia bacterium]
MFLDYLSQFIPGLPQLFIALGLAKVHVIEEYETFAPVNTAAQILYMLCLLLGFAILPYLVGSVAIPRLYCKRVKGVDLCSLGSGKGEIRDVWVHVGRGHAVACLALELLKVLVCLAIGFFCRGADGAAVAGFFCVIGEIMPIWNKMRGTRGFETAALCVLILSPMTFLILSVIFAAVLLGMRFRTPARLFPTLLYPLIANAFVKNANPTMVLLSVGVVIVMLFSHWKNVQDMFNREEERITFKKKKTEEEDA